MSSNCNSPPFFALKEETLLEVLSQSFKCLKCKSLSCCGYDGRLITLVFLLSAADGVWCRESPNEVSPFTEYRGQPQHHSPLPKWFSLRHHRQLQLRWIHTAGQHYTSVSWLEQTDVWERHTTWTTCATRWVQGDEPDRELIQQIIGLNRLDS